MKKNALFLVAIAACSLAFTACSKVEAPYVKPDQPTNPTNPTNPTTPQDGTLLSESFSTSLGAFTTVTTAGAGEWKIDFKTAKASGYDNATKKTTAGTYYLVSPEIDLTKVKEAHIAFEYVFRYNKGDENQQLLITDKYDAQKAAEGWTLLNQQWTEGRDWKTFTKADLDIPAAWMGKKVRIAFRYNKPEHWSPTSGSGNATLKQSTTAQEGKYSVEVSGEDKFNKRLGSADLTLEAGTYTFSTYVRGTAAGSSCRLGYVPVKDGKADSKSYIYEKGYHDNLSTSEWTLVSYTFDLKATTTLSLVVMIPKGKTPFLLDNATLVKK